MNRKKILKLLVATSAVTGGIVFSGQVTQGAELKAAVQVTQLEAVQSSSIQKGQVTGVTTNLRVRDGASTSSTIIGYLNDGAAVEIIGSQDGFYKIKYNGNIGYTSKEYVKVIDNSTSSSNSVGKMGQVINVTSSLRIRQAGSVSSAILGSLKNGDTFQIINKTGSWYNIKVGQTTGFISGDYVQETLLSASSSATPAPTPTSLETSSKSNGKVVNVSTNLRVRQAASSSASVLGYLLNGASVSITGESGDWYAISFNNTTGYVSKAYVSKNVSSSVEPTDLVSTTPTKEETTTKNGHVANVSTNLRVRSEASSSSTVLGYLLNGANVSIIGQSGDWYKINFNGSTGYVSKSYIEDGQASAATNLSVINTSSKYEAILSVMKANLGAPYVWGGAGESLTTSLLNTLRARFPSEAASGAYTRAAGLVNSGYRAFDCSGLMQWAFKQAGVSIGRTTWDQIGYGKEVPLNSIKPGDLLFYGTLQHVGMYIGNGQWIESPGKAYNVRISNVPWAKVTRARRIL